MKESRSSRRIPLVLPFLLLFSCALSTLVGAQGLPQLPAPGNAPNDCGCSRESDAIPVSSGILSPFLPRIPNLELGFLYYFGNRVNTGRFTADYVLPFRLSCDSVLFGEAHAEGWDFWKRSTVSVAAAPGLTVTTSDTSNRVDLSFGGGYRTMLGANTLLGVNGFYDASRLFNKWYSSGGVGLEYAANVAGDDAIDLNFNWYGNLFNRDVLINAFRNQGNSFDVEAGYSHALFNRSLDLRLKLIGYQFDIGTAVQGWRGGADLTTRDGVFTVRYEYGHDRINGDYNTVGGFVTVGLQLENLLSFESPFAMPDPVFRSPRDLRRLLGLKVKRNWHQPEAVVLARSSANPPPTTTCPNLQGLTLIATSIPNGFIFVGQIPNLTTPTITICWCNLLAAANINPTLVDGTSEYLYAASIGPAPTGCVTVTGELGGPASSNGFALEGGGPYPLAFGPEGGISLQVNQ
ncbi:MAG: hypothetical protein ACLP5H_33015 [Desulfomonilaceae bacterium]